MTSFNPIINPNSDPKQLSINQMQPNQPFSIPIITSGQSFSDDMSKINLPNSPITNNLKRELYLENTNPNLGLYLNTLSSIGISLITTKMNGLNLGKITRAISSESGVIEKKRFETLERVVTDLLLKSFSSQ